MKRLDIHIAVDTLDDNLRFRSALFQSTPGVRRPDYAKWMRDDPRIDFALSARGRKTGLYPLGIQVNFGAELAAVPGESRKQAVRCHARSDQTLDPQGIACEPFDSLEAIPMFGEDTSLPVEPSSACCKPATGARP